MITKHSLWLGLATIALLGSTPLPLQTAEASPPTLIVHDLSPLHDAQRVLVNPHKGWYHHYPDTFTGKQASETEATVFPGNVGGPDALAEAVKMRKSSEKR